MQRACRLYSSREDAECTTGVPIGVTASNGHTGNRDGHAGNRDAISLPRSLSSVSLPIRIASRFPAWSPAG